MRPELPLHIGDVARRTRLSPDTLRHYERKGLLPRAPRSSGGYRLYGAETERRIGVIQAALWLGFSLDELVEILRERAQGRAPCRRVRAMAGEKLRAIEARIAELVELRGALAETLSDWDERLASTAPGVAAGLLEAVAARLPPVPGRRATLPSRRSGLVRSASLAVLIALAGSSARADGPPEKAAEHGADCPAHAAHMAQMKEHRDQVDARGDQTMGFSHQATEHHFLLTKDGGAIAVSVLDPADTASTEAIRKHLAQIANDFSAGDFAMPKEIHGRAPPGVPEMVRRRAAIQYRFQPTEYGGRVVIRSKDPKAIEAVHAFLRFQIAEHQTGDPTSLPH